MSIYQKTSPFPKSPILYLLHQYSAQQPLSLKWLTYLYWAVLSFSSPLSSSSLTSPKPHRAYSEPIWCQIHDRQAVWGQGQQAFYNSQCFSFVDMTNSPVLRNPQHSVWICVCRQCRTCRTTAIDNPSNFMWIHWVYRYCQSYSTVHFVYMKPHPVQNTRGYASTKDTPFLRTFKLNNCSYNK